jgi:hypothetical protein
MLRNPELNNQTYISGSHKWKYYNRPKIPFIQQNLTDHIQSNSQMVHPTNQPEHTLTHGKGKTYSL